MTPGDSAGHAAPRPEADPGGGGRAPLFVPELFTVLRMSLLALLSHWRRHPLQCISILVGLWLGTALWSGVQAINAQARADYARASAVLSLPAQIQWVARHGERLDEAVYVQLRRLGWRVSPVLEGRLHLAGEAGPALRLIGVEPLGLPDAARVAGVSGDAIDIGAFIGAPGQAWIAPDTLHRLGASEGDRALASDGQRLPPFLVQPQLAPGVVIMDIGYAQQLLGTAGAISRLLVAGDPAGEGDPPPEFASVLQRLPASGDDDLQRLTDSFHLNLTALGLLAFIVGLFIVHAAIGLALEQRRALLRTLRACGVSLRGLIGALALELGLFALIGGLAGVASGYLLAGVLLGDVAASLRGLYGAEVAGQLSLSPTWWLAGLAMSLLGALLAGASSLVRAAHLPLLALAQPQAWRRSGVRWLRRQAALAAVLVVIGALLALFGDSLASALLLLAMMLLAAALLLPALLDAALAALSRCCRGPLSAWFVADSRQQLPAVALALMALLLTLGASVGVGSMTEGFRLTFTGWLDQRLAAELYLSPRDTAQSQAIAEWLQHQPDVSAVLPNWHVELRLQGWPTRVQGIAADPAYRQQWPLLEQRADAWVWLDSGEGAMLSEQLARRLDAGLGARLLLPADEGPRALTVVGIYADYGNPKGHVLVNADWLRTHRRDAVLRSLGVRMAPTAVPALQAELERVHGLDAAHAVDQASLKRWSTEVFDRTFIATAALNRLTLGVAGVALFISLLTLGYSRLGQLAPLWALGVTRAQLAGLTLAQTMMLACLTVLLAMPLGLLLAWGLVAIVNVQAFGWRLPLHVFPGQLLQLGLLGLLTALLATAWPMRQLARSQPADLLRQFSDER